MAQKNLKVNIVEPAIEEQIPEKIEDKNPIKNNQNNNSSSNNGENKDNTNNQKPIENNSEKITSDNKPTEKIIKYFLFSDGYTMMNVAEACASELKKINKTGMCSPIQDDKGIYLGMKLEIQ